MKLHRLLYLVSSWTLLLSLPIPFAQAGGGGAGPGGSTGSLTGTTSPAGSRTDVSGAGGSNTVRAQGTAEPNKEQAAKNEQHKAGTTAQAKKEPVSTGRKDKGEKEDSFSVFTLQLITTAGILASVI
uniref:12 kDa protein n=1 Tax=Babesia gibsoni TaxID=33632 RepID=E3UKR5_BABGI|nr:12 kDa protein [Babesia gibsoni]